MKRLLILTALLSLSAFAADPAALIQDFKGMLPKYGLAPITEQTFCYNDGTGVQGYQVDKMQRLASVTKLLSTYLASETLDLNKRFETKLYISGDRLHIEGSRDPYFEEEKIMLLMSALNSLGYTSFKTITFDKNFIFTDVALESHAEITPEHTKSRIATYFNSKNTKFVRSMWLAAYNFAREENVDLDKSITPMVNANSVTISDVNPLVDLKPTVYIHRSKVFHDILKSMNVMSKNIVAHNVFLEAGRIKKFDLLLQEKGFDKKTFQIYNGSGLPMKTGETRKDNLMSCRSILKVIELLTKSLEKHKLKLSDVVAVNGGQDLGSFRSRFLKYPETHQAVLSKTGTLMNASSLAGVLMTDQAIPFAILNHTSSSASARKFQDSFVDRLFHHLGEPFPIVYTKISIFPWDGSDFLKLSF